MKCETCIHYDREKSGKDLIVCTAPADESIGYLLAGLEDCEAYQSCACGCDGNCGDDCQCEEQDWNPT